MRKFLTDILNLWNKEPVEVVQIINPAFENKRRELEYFLQFMEGRGLVITDYDKLEENIESYIIGHL